MTAPSSTRCPSRDEALKQRHPGRANRGAGSGHVANGILHQLHDDELLEHQSRIRAVIARYRECALNEIPWIMTPPSETKHDQADRA
jgi:hypothetical protein